MDSLLILQALETHAPLFTTRPKIAAVRLGGDECELGNVDQNGEAGADFSRLPTITNNGGEIYMDMEHVEICTPETTNPVDRVRYLESMRRIAWSERYAHKLYCHCVDGNDNPFGGSHENYFTCAEYTEWPTLIPFLITRTLFAGTGNWIRRVNSPHFEISQRARFIRTPISGDTTSNRGIINMRPEPLSSVPGWKRMHVIYSEPTMCETATFLRTGLMMLAIEMLEIGALPDIAYDRDESVSDLHCLSGQMNGWFLRGVTKGPKSAVELLGRYVERARELFLGRDEVTNAVIIIAEDTLQKLALDPMQLLFGRLDWVTKFEALRYGLEEFPDPIKNAYEWLRSQEMEWHNLDPNAGLYYALCQTEQVERIVSDNLIMEAVKEPPPDTRAYVRGKTQQILKAEGRGRELNAQAWECLYAVNAAVNRPWEKSAIEKEKQATYWKEPIPNPLDPGRELLKRIGEKISRGK